MVKKFHARTTREALRKVRDSLGANALILSNRNVDGGVEIIAAADMDIDALTTKAEPALELPSRKAPEVRAEPRLESPHFPTPPKRIPSLEHGPIPELTTLTDYLAQREGSVIRPSPTRKNGNGSALLRPTASPNIWHEPAIPRSPPAPPPPKPAEPPPPAPAPAPDTTPEMRELAHEMRMLRALVEGQLAGLAWNDACRREPARAEVMKHLMSAGFSPALSRQILDRMPPEPDQARALKWVQAAIVKNLRVADPINDLIELGGVYALVGPTGVGKTTTVAKLAARAVMNIGDVIVVLI